MNFTLDQLGSILGAITVAYDESYLTKQEAIELKEVMENLFMLSHSEIKKEELK